MTKSLATLIALTLTFAAHRGRADVPEQTFSTREILEDTFANPSVRAERLARIAESLLMPHSLDLAAEVLAEALKLDPRNPRALFYQRAFGPIFTLKGYMSRLQPLIERTETPDFVRSYYRALNDQWPYFRGEQKDITTDREMRQLLRRLGEAWGAARAYFAEAAVPLELRTVWINADYRRTREQEGIIWEWRDGQWTQRPGGPTVTVDERVDGLSLAAIHCRADQPERGVYHVEACPHLTVRDYTLDFADIEAMRGYAAGHQLLGILDTAYNTDGATALWARAFAAPTRDITDVEIALPLVQAGAGALEADHQLAKVRELGTDIFGAVKWLMRMQADLCHPRPGFVWNQGICLTGDGFDENDLRKALALTEATLAGSPIDVNNGRGFATQARLHRIYDAPVEHLNLVAPNLFNKNGWAVSLPDASLNGIFPAGDAPQFYRLKGQ